MVRTKKHKLNVEPDLNFSVIGLVSSARIYKLAYILNQAYELSFSQHDSITTTEGCMLERYLHTDDYQVQNYELIQNKADCGYFLKAHKNIDYFLVVRTQADKSTLPELLVQLKKAEQIQAAFLLDELSPQQQKNFAAR